jgi:F-type H+/Na+-transporting ATPase subunit beta
MTAEPNVNSARDKPLLGRTVAVHGSVIDVAFPIEALPAIEEAIAIETESGPPVLAEVHQHLSPNLIRAVALENAAGLRRGTAVHATGAALRVPVGDAVLGRLLNAVGEPADRLGALPAGSAQRRKSSTPASK